MIDHTLGLEGPELSLPSSSSSSSVVIFRPLSEVAVLNLGAMPREEHRTRYRDRIRLNSFSTSSSEDLSVVEGLVLGNSCINSSSRLILFNIRL
jgi:hypothetical protein